MWHLADCQPVRPCMSGYRFLRISGPRLAPWQQTLLTRSGHASPIPIVRCRPGQRRPAACIDGRVSLTDERG